MLFFFLSLSLSGSREKQGARVCLWMDGKIWTAHYLLLPSLRPLFISQMACPLLHGWARAVLALPPPPSKKSICSPHSWGEAVLMTVSLHFVSLDLQPLSPLGFLVITGTPGQQHPSPSARNFSMSVIQFLQPVHWLHNEQWPNRPPVCFTQSNFWKGSSGLAC